VDEVGVTYAANMYTATGLHMGSSAYDVRSALGEPSRTKNEGNVQRLYCDSLGIRFDFYTSGSNANLVATIIVYKPGSAGH
jgi:hypothetical protein